MQSYACYSSIDFGEDAISARSRTLDRHSSSMRHMKECFGTLMRECRTTAHMLLMPRF
jgi:hypothetical protein